jgi:signal transduction histidine kinase
MRQVQKQMQSVMTEDMSQAEPKEQPFSHWDSVSHLEQRLKDYIALSRKLIWQRQAIFFAATVLSASYFDPVISILCYLGVLSTEVMDIVLSRRIMKWTDHSEKKARRFLYWIIANTLFSAGAISLFVIETALQQSTGGHFTPLFFLFAASLFAAMNDHLLMAALTLRLTIYGGTFFYIALMDILPSPPPLTDQPWLEFFTTVFVLYFILDCSFVFLRLYRRNLKQMDELRIEHEKTLHAYEVKSKFLSTVSHELRTPLTSIKASIDLINMGVVGQLPDKMVTVLQNAGKNSKRLADLIDDLLDIQKIEAGEMIYHFSPINVRSLVLESIEANRGLADHLGIAIESRFPDADVFLEGDDVRLMQVMANLLSNALKFSKKGCKVEVFVQNMDHRVRISVKDNGVGISSDSRELVFGKFTQVDSSDQRQVGGTGLGMHISKQIVERHNGIIDYTSVVGQGTTFFVEFAEKQAARSSELAAA